MNAAKVELHLHLDGSLNIKWAYQKLLQRNVLDTTTSFEDFYDILYSMNKEHTADNFLKFDLLCKTLQYEEDLYEATYNLVELLSKKGLIYAEIRFASQQHCLEGLSQKQALKAVIDGAKAACEKYPIKIGIINCLMHKGNSAAFNYKENIETILATEEYLGQGAVALDLAGYENNCDFKDYGNLFEVARVKNIPYTIHAGEMGVGSHIMDALEMKPYRIGHGINCIQDETYLKAVVDKQIPLEVCVSSNIKSSGDNYSRHPIRQLIEAGAKVTINTDNIIFSKSDLLHEYAMLELIGVSEKQLQQCTLNAIDAAFISEEEKNKLRGQLSF
ncbi:MAG: adenosine deaminase [Erysipelotrichaceae bacterium]|nr:adenosine deaminase [Erysipelotrichaceae bacterium]